MGAISVVNVLPSKIRKRLARWAALRWLLATKTREFRHERNYDLRLVDKGFADRLAAPVNDTVLLERIACAYNNAKIAQQDAAPVFQVSNEWLPIYASQMQEVMAALSESDLVALARIYRNFMREPCSTGLHGLPVDMRRYYFNGNIGSSFKHLFLCDALHRYRLWHALLGERYQVSDLASPMIGNPYGYFIDGTFVKVGSDYLHYYATIIGRLVRARRRRIIVELGGGYGGMAYYLLRDNDYLSYVDFDLPENLALTTYYLLTAFPEKKALLFGEAELTPEAVASHDIILMPNFAMAMLPDDSVDLTFNSYSLAEMSGEAIAAYISHISRITARYFLHVNHNKDALVIADDFGVSPDRFDLLYKIPALWNAGRSLQMDEYEYLYRRIRDDG